MITVLHMYIILHRALFENPFFVPRKNKQLVASLPSLLHVHVDYHPIRNSLAWFDLSLVQVGRKCPNSCHGYLLPNGMLAYCCHKGLCPGEGYVGTIGEKAFFDFEIGNLGNFLVAFNFG